MVAMSRGYNSYIHVNQVALCSDKCATTRFNSTCPPVALRQGYRAHKTCNCSDDGLNKQELNCDDNIVRAKDNSSLPQVSVASLHSYKCVISNRQELAPFFVNRRSASRHHLTMIILSNLLVGDRAHDRVISQQSLRNDSDDNHKIFEEGSCERHVNFGHNSLAIQLAPRAIQPCDLSLRGIQDI